jgi:HK97 family phage prohead protease
MKEVRGMTHARMYDDSQAHPHVPAGSPAGGQFAPKGGKGGKTPAKAPAKKSGPARPPARKQDDGTLSYDPGSNKGTGYSSANGDPRVHKLQQALNRLGLTDSAGKALKDDGKLGPKTTSAVKKLQKRLGLPQDGKVSPALLEKIAGLKSLPRRSDVLDLCVRSFGFEFEQRAKGDGRTLEGYAAVFNVPAKIRDVGGDFEETILPGAFKRSLGERMPILQWDHGKDPRVGTVPIGAIEDLAEDSNGLHVRARLFDNDVVEPVRQAIEARAIRGMSFRFGVPDGGDDWPSRDQRHVRDADVHELGPVAFPAYDATSVSVRSLLAQLDPAEHRTLLRELAAELRLAVDLEDIVGQSDARSDDGDDPDAEPSGEAPTETQLRQRLDDGALRARGILL